MEDNTRTSRPDRWMSSIRMPFSTRGVPAQRHRLTRELEEHALPTDTAHDASLVLDELVTNALQHGAPLDDDSLEICWGAWGDEVHLEVTDGGAATVPLATSAVPSAIRGRGLGIVAALTTSWGIRAESHTMTVWACLPSARRQPAPDHRP